MVERILGIGLLFFAFFLAKVNAQMAANQADSIYAALSWEERIAQLFIVRANQAGGPYLKAVDDAIEKYGVGGVCFFRSHPSLQLAQTIAWQQKSKIPLLITMDAEWGLAMRLDSVPSYPFQMTLGALRNDQLIYEMGSQIAQQLKLMGIHMNFAPVADINDNPMNPVIGMRSFGQNPLRVSRKSYAYMKGMQDHGVLAVAKHFPGHGDTHQDSHFSFPLIEKDSLNLSLNELFPFELLIRKKIAAIMTAHLQIPVLEPDSNLPSSLSKNVVKGLLQNTMGFDGLVVTDGLEMRAVTDRYAPGELEMKALQAGNDLLLLPQNFDTAIQFILQGLSQGEIDSLQIEASCKKVLQSKIKAGLTSNYNPSNSAHLFTRLNTRQNEELIGKLYRQSLTLVHNADQIIPIRKTDTLDIAILNIGTQGDHDFRQGLSSNMAVTSYFMPANISEGKFPDPDSLAKHNLILINLRNTNIYAHRNYGIESSTVEFLEEIAANNTAVLNLFASPYALNVFSDPFLFSAIVIAYQDHPQAARAAAELVSGLIPARGIMPVHAHKVAEGTSLKTYPSQIIRASPEEMGVDLNKLSTIDSLVTLGIQKKAYPGAQLMAVWKGRVIYQKSFGFHTYDSIRPVSKTDIYDLASLTKVFATSLALMKLREEGLIMPDDYLSEHLKLDDWKGKDSIRIREVLAHQSGLRPWIPYYFYTLDSVDFSWDANVLQQNFSPDFNIQLADQLWVQKDYPQVVIDSILQSAVHERTYKYSDLGFYLLKKMVEEVSGQKFETYLADKFYTPLGLQQTGFRPREWYPLQKIVPTEIDTFFRKQIVHGFVHDQGAALMGGVSGHAGLFSNAEDLAVLMQMLLNDGNYKGVDYLHPATIDEFTSVQYPENNNRRAMGFDKPMLEFREHGTNCRSVSPESFGHSGFTGTYVWADPQSQLIYVFLSNRTFPDMNNSKLMDLDIRTKIHELLYEAIGRSAETHESVN